MLRAIYCLVRYECEGAKTRRVFPGNVPNLIERRDTSGPAFVFRLQNLHDVLVSVALGQHQRRLAVFVARLQFDFTLINCAKKNYKFYY
jgi:hypothetical protein